jgi:hypothetical protein
MVAFVFPEEGKVPPGFLPENQTALRSRRRFPDVRWEQCFQLVLSVSLEIWRSKGLRTVTSFSGWQDLLPPSSATAWGHNLQSGGLGRRASARGSSKPLPLYQFPVNNEAQSDRLIGDQKWTTVYEVSAQICEEFACLVGDAVLNW